MNTVVWHLQRFFQIIGLPDALLPLAAFLVLMVGVWAIYTGIIKFRMMRRTFDRKDAAFWLFISPWLIGFLLFTLGPMLFSLFISLTRWNLLTSPKVIGLKNYTDALQDDLARQALKVTFYFALLSVPTVTFASFMVALLMNSRVRGMNVFRTLWYLPSLVVGVPQIVLFLAFFKPDGTANKLLSLLGIKGPSWFQSPTWAMPTIVIMGLWTVGGGMLVYLAGLQDIPSTLYEAVTLDGGGIVRKWWTVTVPQMSPIIFFNFLTGLIGAMQVFTQGFVASNGGSGGPGNSLLFVVVYLYNNAFVNFKMGYASALAWILFVIILAMTLLTFRLSSNLVYYEAGQRRPPGRRARPRKVADHVAV